MRTSRAVDPDSGTSMLWVSSGLVVMASVVLVGWHAHISPAVQIFPGLIPMQYNTALCFLALGVAGVGLSVGRPLLMVCGGGGAALMGAAVVLEYATHVSLGIDTLFFYPWERALSSDPGRMALTTAVSFAITGVGMTLLAWRPDGYGVFGLLNSVPVSLGLTSLIGYAFQITFVLPFSLGSQMALATCLAFVAYGSVALGYSLRRAERGADGMPWWTFGLGIAFLPTLLVAVSAVFPQESWRSESLKMALSVAGVALIAAGFRKMTTAKVANKGLVIAAGPLVLLLALVGLVVRLERQGDSAESWALHSAEVLLVTQALESHLTAAESAAGRYVLTGDTAFVAPYEKASALLAATSTRLQTLVSDNVFQETNASAIAQRGTEYTARQSDLVRSIHAGADRAVTDSVGAGVGAALANRVRGGIETFSQEEARLGLQRRAVMMESRQRLNWLLVSGTAAAILQTTLLALSFRRSISGRLQRLRQNAIGLAAGEVLAPRLSGDDEIADLDRVFHEMAAALGEVTRRERAIIAGATDGIAIKDLEHRYVMVNAWCATSLGKTVEQMVGKTIFDLFEPETAQRILERDNVILAGGTTATSDLVAAPKGGVARIYSSTYGPYLDQHGALIGVISMSRDITTQRQQDAAIAEMGRDQLRFKDEFLSHVSHELRSPLAAIKEFTSILQDELSGGLNSDQHNYLRIILRNVQQQQSMIDDLLEVTRLETGKLTVAPDRVSVPQAVTDSVETLQGPARAKQITVASELAASLPWVYADGTRLRQILIILIDNAIKFTPPGGAIRVGARVLPQDSTFVVVDVSDTGPGIGPEAAARIFERLYQEGTSGLKTHKGLGLGLYISKELVVRQGGCIWVESEPPQGSRFLFTVPVFSLGSVIAPLLRNGQWPSDTVAVVVVHADRPTGWRTSEDREQWSQEVRGMVQRCLMPDRDTLLPVGADTGPDRLFVAAFADHAGASVLTQRIQSQFDRLTRVRAPGLTLSVTYRLIELLPSAETGTTETIVANMAAQLEGLVASLTAT